VQYVAVCALSRIHDPRVVLALLPAFRSPHPEVAVLAIRGAAAQEEPWLLPRLINEFGMRDVNPLLVGRVAAACELAKRGYLGGVPLLFKMLKENTPIADETNREWDPRERVAWEKELAIAALRGVLGSDFGYNENASVVAQAQIVTRMQTYYEEHCVELQDRAPPLTDPKLLSLVRRLIGGLGGFQLRNVDDARFILEALGKKIGDLLAEGAFADSFYVRFHSLEVLALFREEGNEDERARFTKKILPTLEDKDPAIREQAATTAGELKSKAALNALRDLLRDPELGVRKAALLALGRLGEKEALAILEGHFKPSEPKTGEEVCALAAQIRLGNKSALEPFVTGIFSADSEVRATTLDLLSALIGRDLGLTAGKQVDPEAASSEARDLLNHKFFSEK
jgi:hypothetical protein